MDRDGDVWCAETGSAGACVPSWSCCGLWCGCGALLGTEQFRLCPFSEGLWGGSSAQSPSGGAELWSSVQKLLSQMLTCSSVLLLIPGQPCCVLGNH